MVHVPEVAASFGPIKVDVFPVGGRRRIQPPWVLSAATLVPIDGHFWDWTLWLGGKSLRGERARVAGELVKMHDFVLGPMGVPSAPATLGEALSVYVRARASAMNELGVFVDPELGRQVSGALERHWVIACGAHGCNRGSRPAHAFDQNVGQFPALSSTHRGRGTSRGQAPRCNARPEPSSRCADGSLRDPRCRWVPNRPIGRLQWHRQSDSPGKRPCTSQNSNTPVPPCVRRESVKRITRPRGRSAKRLAGGTIQVSRLPLPSASRRGDPG
jgi:hypothetical protein